jgi:hypothetical protein
MITSKQGINCANIVKEQAMSFCRCITDALNVAVQEGMLLNENSLCTNRNNPAVYADGRCDGGEMNTIKFSHNWNNKLECDMFTTIRKHTPDKHKYYTSEIGKEFRIMLNDLYQGMTVLDDVICARFDDIYYLLVEMDTGMKYHKAVGLFKSFGITEDTEVMILLFKKSKDVMEGR